MPRARTVPDADIFAAVRQLLSRDGEKGVAFSAVAQATGLAAPTLVQRYRSIEGMVRAALADAWTGLDARVEAAEAAAAGRAAPAFLKALSDDAAADAGFLAMSLRDPELRPRAEAWRGRVEAALAARLGGGAKGREAASILFAAWQGQRLWQSAGGKAFRLKAAAKRLS
jgi:AcrR family transcriptional regulator